MKLRYLILSLIAFFILTTHSVYATSSEQSQAVNAQQQNKKLPRKDINRFLKAIAVIKHYYIKPVTDQQLFTNSIKGMVSNLDPHSSYLGPDAFRDLQSTVSGNFVGIGIELTTQGGALKVISPLAGTPAARAGIKANDLIVKVNGKYVQDMTLRQAINHIKGKVGTKVHLTILRKGVKKPLTLTITRDTIKLIAIKSKLLESGYGYIKINFFQGPVEKELHHAIKNLTKQAGGHLKGLVLDLRNNPGGLLDMSAKVADTFLNAKTATKKYHDLIVYTKGRMPGSEIKFKLTRGDMLDGVPMVVLINGGTASASEIVAGALQDYKRAIIMGTRSFGKGSVQTVIPLSKDSAIKLTTALYYTPSGRVIQAQGIEPNIVVPELTVRKKPISGLLDFDESDYQNHLHNNSNSKLSQQKLRQLKKLRQQELAIAQKDYQLYEGLMMLKGMNAIKI